MATVQLSDASVTIRKLKLLEKELALISAE